jgi:Flp pilus assembly protein TadD
MMRERADLGLVTHLTVHELQRAADLNPWSSRPLEAEAAIATANKDRPRALRAVDEGLGRIPDEWILYLLKAKALGRSDPPAARRALARAKELNPSDPEIDEVANDLGVGS